MPIPSDLQDFATVLRRWVAIERAPGDGDRYGGRHRAVLDMRDLFHLILALR